MSGIPLVSIAADFGRIVGDFVDPDLARETIRLSAEDYRGVPARL
jgi:hypothetical protein